MAILVILVSAPSEEVAQQIGKTLVERKLAACVSILPKIHSIYSWKGALEQEEEALLLIKTTDERYDALELTVSELHPYETPEILALQSTKGLEQYCRWVEEQTAPTEETS